MIARSFYVLAHQGSQTFNRLKSLSPPNLAVSISGAYNAFVHGKRPPNLASPLCTGAAYVAANLLKIAFILSAHRPMHRDLQAWDIAIFP